MATSNKKTDNSNIVSGKVILKETGIGIPDLLVVIYDLDPGTKPDEFIRGLFNPVPEGTAVPAEANVIIGGGKVPTNSLGFLGDRIGSVLTGQDGTFSISYYNQEFQILNETEKRPDLFLLILGPEEPNQSIQHNLLYYSSEIRQNAGRCENYNIQLTTELFEKKKMEIPKGNTKPNVDSQIDEFKRRNLFVKTYNTAILSEETAKVNEKKSRLIGSKTVFRKLFAPKPIAPESSFVTFIGEDETVASKFGDHMQNQLEEKQKKIQDHIDANKGIEVNFLLNNSDRIALSINTGLETTLPFTDIQSTEPLKSLLHKMNSAGSDNLILTSNNPILKKCLSKADDTICASKKLDIPIGGAPTDTKEVITFSILPDSAKAFLTGNHGGDVNIAIIYKYTSAAGVVRYEAKLLDGTLLHFDSNGENTDIGIATPLTSAEITSYVKKVISDIRSVKEAQNSANSKPDQNSVNENVNKFNLKKGPAEQASFFDFQVLNCAFGHIWQQLIDDTPAQLASEIKDIASNRGYVLADTYNSKQALMADFRFMYKVLNNPPQSIISNFDITYEEWNALELDAQEKMRNICDAIDKATAGLIFQPAGTQVGLLGMGWGNFGATTTDGYRRVSTHEAQQYIQELKAQGELIIDYMRNSHSKAFHKILTDLDKALKSNYAFNIFGADDSAKAINFGLLNTYRQKWEPVAYQVGNLVKSIPLSPKEEKKYSLKTTFNRKRTEKEARKNNSSLTQEQNTTSRAEEEIVSKANSKTNFTLGAEGSYGSFKVTSSLGLEAAKESSQNKKEFRESVLKATQEFKEERSVEIDTEESLSSEYTESGTIVNPNDELAVTYLFYELQKRFKVSEQLYRIMPVVLVAQEVPAPNEITEAWVIAHDWILNRVILDDSFRPALQYIAQKNVGDDFSIREFRRNLRTQRQLVETLKRELASLSREADSRYQSLQRMIETRIKAQEDEESDSFWDDLGESVFGAEKATPESAKAREMAARDAQAYAADKAQQTGLHLQREMNTLQSITADYNKAMRDHLDKKTMVERLLLHIKNNIIYYMQSIWSMEPADQRFMRLMNVEVPQYEIESMGCEIMQKPENDLFQLFRGDDETLHKAWIKPVIREGAEPKTLVEVADLDTILGFKGNYIAFPMKNHNALTEIMAMPYVDASFGAMDPDQLSNVSLEDYSRYVCCLRNELSESEFDALKTTLKDWLSMLLSDPLRNGDEIIVPTTSLYIEMLVSANSLLEDFKLKHREWDVYKVQEEVQMAALENLRLAQRILDKKLEDPKIDKKIVVEGNTNPTIDTDI